MLVMCVCILVKMLSKSMGANNKKKQPVPFPNSPVLMT